MHLARDDIIQLCLMACCPGTPEQQRELQGMLTCGYERAVLQPLYLKGEHDWQQKLQFSQVATIDTAQGVDAPWLRPCAVMTIAWNVY